MSALAVGCNAANGDVPDSIPSQEKEGLREFAIEPGERPWHINGAWRGEGDRVDGRLEGVWTWYWDWPERRKFREGRYRNDVLHGRSVYWHENGTRAVEGDYVEGRKDGIWMQWYETGELWWRGRYQDGLAERLWVHWYPDGKKKEEGRFSGNWREGYWAFWNPDGTLDLDRSGVYVVPNPSEDVPPRNKG